MRPCNRMPAYDCPDSCAGNPCWVQDTINTTVSEDGWEAKMVSAIADGSLYSGNRFADGAPGEHGHYSRFTPQPIDIIAAWNLNHWQAEALTYLVRYDMKGGREDLEKAIWYINDLIKRKYGDS